MSKHKDNFQKGPPNNGAAKSREGQLRTGKEKARNEFNLEWIASLLFCLAIGLYINTLNHDFSFDDSVVITGDKYTRQGFEGIKTLATQDLFYGIYGKSLDLEGGRWRPLTLVLFAIEYQFFGDNATPYHLINI